jgi:hypothetical protein
VLCEGEAEPAAATTSHFSQGPCTRKPSLLSSSRVSFGSGLRLRFASLVVVAKDTSPTLAGSCELMTGTRGRGTDQKE